jgi:alkylation response protein AidB-like acyl-CoA dehydrogenase
MTRSSRRPTTSDLAEFRARIQAFVGERLLGQEAYLDSAPDPPLPLHGEFQAAGLSGWWIPCEYGGRGFGLEDSVDIVADLAYADSSFALTFGIQIISTQVIALYGSDEMKERWLPRIAAGQGYASTAGSEREAGSNVDLFTSTVATPDGGDYVLRGRKFFCTNLAYADHVMVLARLAGDKIVTRMFLVPRASEGLVVLRRWPLIGSRSLGTYELALDGCRVPASAMLAPDGAALGQIGLNGSRTLIAATVVGMCRRIRDICLDYARGKSISGRPLVRNSTFARKLGRIEAQIASMRHVCRAAGRAYDALWWGPNPAEAFLRERALAEVLEAKMYCGQVGWEIASLASEMFGGLGYTDDVLIGKLMRDIRVVSIVEVGDDHLRNIIYQQKVLAPHRERQRTRT